MSAEAASAPLVDTNPQGKNVLSEDEARERSSIVKDVKYTLALSLEAGSSSYDVDLKISFKGKSNQGTFLDFVGGGSISTMEINGVAVTGPVWESNRLQLQGDLMKDQNEVMLKYRNLYDHSGSGFHQFIDPEDNQEYLYTDFEPFDAHRLFPCFDQPDIKAVYNVTVTAPNEWKVITNYTSTSNPAEDGKRIVWKCQETVPFSTYLFAIIVGPYEIFSDTVVAKRKEIPLKVYCRKSLEKHLKDDIEEIFTITKQGMQFYTDFFDYAYPFSKYDQIFVPEFNSGAMENVGAVTFHENYVFRETPTEGKRCGRAMTVLHEMAHMWFGNLVSPVWWDGLWLNESFATYMEALAVSKSTRFSSMAWQDFNGSMKKWAMKADQQSTTHPIQGSIVDTDATFLNFDGITYGKGASTLKQLVAVVSEDGLKAGMQYYFKKHEFGNTTIGDFLAALQHGYDLITKDSEEDRVNLESWAKLWLETAGLNRLTPEFTVGEDKNIIAFNIHQDAPEGHPTLRPHMLDVALFDVTEDGLPTLRSAMRVHVLAKKSTPIPQLCGMKEPAFVFINYEDHAYAKVLLDSKSLAFVWNNIDKFENTLLRHLLWDTLIQMTRDADKLRASDFITLARRKLPLETDSKLMGSILWTLEGALNWIPEDKFVSKSVELFDMAHEMLLQAKEQDARINLANSLIRFANNREAAQKLVTMMENGTGVEGFEFDQAMRWGVVITSAAFAVPGYDERITSEEKRDPSDRGRRKVEKAKASTPTAEAKRDAWKKILEDKESSIDLLSATMEGFHWRFQRELLREYETKFFELVREQYKTREKEYGGAFANCLFPFFPEDDEIFKQVERLLSELEQDEKLAERSLKESLDDLKRCRKCRDFDKESHSPF